MSDRVVDPEISRIATEVVAHESEQKQEKPLKPARSEAELHAVKQRNVQIGLVASILIALKTFGII
jgi:hypothetical protein